MRNPLTSAVLPGAATLTVKCLKCKDTYEVEDAVVSFELVLDPDTDQFVQYDVTFTYAGEPLWIQDLLCLPNYCSVFGRLPNGSVFAFPWLVCGSGWGEVWHSRPDSKGVHYAMRPART